MKIVLKDGTTYAIAKFREGYSTEIDGSKKLYAIITLADDVSVSSLISTFTESNVADFAVNTDDEKTTKKYGYGKVADIYSNMTDYANATEVRLEEPSKQA